MESTAAVQLPDEAPAVSLAIVETPLPREKNGRFTPEIAREMARKALEAKRRKKAERIARLNAPAKPREIPEAAAAYVDERIVRMRAHIERLDKLLERARCPKRIKFIADSLAKLQDSERILSGRPLPGQMKPGKAPVSRPSASALGPVD